MSKLAVASVAALALVAGAARAEEPAALKYGAWGFDLTAMDPKTRPGDDFFRYANGAWLDRTPIPADKAAVSLRVYESDLAEARQGQVDELGQQRRDQVVHAEVAQVLEAAQGAGLARTREPRDDQDLLRLVHVAT